MARKPDDDIDFDEINFDDMEGGGGDDGEGSFDGPESKPKARNPISTVAGSFASGVKGAMLDPNQQVRFIRSAMPAGYQQAIDVAGEVVGGARTLYDEALKEAQPVIKDMKKGVRLFLPGLKSVLPGKLGEKLEGWAADAGKSNPQVDPEESEISMNLGSIFSAYQEAQQNQAAEADAKQEVRDVALVKQGAANLQGIAALQNSIGRLVSYQDQVTVQFQRKSLELQYRQFFTQRKLLDTMQQHLDVTKSSFEVIAKNTSLPDILKAHDSEKARELLKMKFLGAVTEPFSQFSRGIGRRILTKAKADIKGFFSGIGGAINDAVMGLEMASEASADMGVSGGEMAGDMAGGMLADAAVGKLREKLAPKLRAQLEKLGLFNAGNFALLRMFSEAPEMINQWAGRATENQGVFGTAEDWLKGAVGTHKINNKVQGSMVDSLDQATQFDLQTRKTITDVIPGWLSKIHLELKMTRTKGRDDEAEQFDWDTGEFVKQSTIGAKLRDKIAGKSDRDYKLAKMNELLKKFDPKEELPKHIRNTMARYFLERSQANKPMTLSVFIHPEAEMLLRAYFPNRADLELVQSFLINRFGKDESLSSEDWLPDGTVKGMRNKLWGGFGKGAEQQEELAKVQDSFKSFTSVVTDQRPMEDLLKYAKADGIHHLVKEKLVVWDERSKEWVRNTKEVSDDLIKAFEEQPPTPTPPAPGDATPPAPQNNGPEYEGGLPFRAMGGPIHRAGGGGVPSRIAGQIKNFAAGTAGAITAPGDGSVDTQPAMLANGEVVVNQPAASLPGVGQFLGHLNKLGRRMFGKRGKRELTTGPTDAAAGPLGDNGPMVGGSVEDLMQASTAHLSAIHQLVEEMSKKPFLGIALPNMDGALGGIEKMLVGGYRGAKKGAGHLWDFAGKSAGVAKDGIKGAFTLTKDLLRGAWNIGKGVGKSIFGGVTDLVVKGTDRIALEAQKIKDGEYIDVLTGKVITSVEDITGEVKDKAGNIVLKAEEFAKGLYTTRGKKIIEGIKGGLGFAKDLVLAPFKIVKTVGTGIMKFIDMPEDLYVPADLKTPRVRAHLFRNGAYHLEDGTVPARYADITGNLYDANNNIVLTPEEIKAGLVNVEGKPIKGIGDKLGDLVVGGFKISGHVMELGIKAAKWAGEAMGKGWGALKGLITGVTGFTGFGIFSSNRLMVTRLEQIFLLLNNRMPGTPEPIPGDFGGKGLSDAGVPGGGPGDPSAKSALLSLKGARKRLGEWFQNRGKPKADEFVGPVQPPPEIMGPMPQEEDHVGAIRTRLLGFKDSLKSGKSLLGAAWDESWQNAKKQHFGSKPDEFVGPMPEQPSDFMGPMPEQGKPGSLKTWLQGVIDKRLEGKDIKQVAEETKDNLKSKATGVGDRLKGWYNQKMHTPKPGDFVGPMPQQPDDFTGPMPDLRTVQLIKGKEFFKKLKLPTALTKFLQGKSKELPETTEDLDENDQASLKITTADIERARVALGNGAAEILESWRKAGISKKEAIMARLIAHKEEAKDKAANEPKGPDGKPRSALQKLNYKLGAMLPGIARFNAINSLKRTLKDARKDLTPEQLKASDKAIADLIDADYRGGVVSAEQYKLLIPTYGEEPKPAEEAKPGEGAAKGIGAKLASVKSGILGFLGKKKGNSNDTDGDGIREGSAADQAKEKAVAEEKSRFGRMQDMFTGLMGRLKKDKEDDKKEGKGLFGMLSSLKGFSLMGVITGLGTVFTKALGLMGPLGKVIGMAGTVLKFAGKGAWGTAKLGWKATKLLGKGAQLLGKGAMHVGKFVARGGLTTALRVGATILGGPVGWAIGAALLVYGAYKLYQKMSKDETPLLAFRMAQYGFDVEDTEDVKKILDLEATLKKITQVSKTSPAVLGPGKTPEDLFKPFGVDPQNTDQVEKWMAWFIYRFKPVYLSSMTVYFSIKNKLDLERADLDLLSTEKLDYIKRTHFALDANCPYNTMANPFAEKDEVDFNPEKTQDAYKDAYEDIQDEAKKQDAKVMASRNVDKKQQKKVEESSWWKSTKGFMSSTYDDAVAGTTKVIEKLAGWREKAVDATSSAIGKGVEGYHAAVDATSRAIEVTAKAFNSLKGTAKEKFQQVLEAARRAGDPHPEIVAAQWALESGWGKHESGKFNFFGIKARADEPGTMRKTREVLGGKDVKITDKFRDYNSLEEGIAGRVGFINKNPRYRKAGYHDAQTPYQAALALQTAGYATDPKYASLLSKLIASAGIDPNQPSGSATAGSLTPVVKGPTTLPGAAGAKTAAPAAGSSSAVKTPPTGAAKGPGAAAVATGVSSAPGAPIAGVPTAGVPDAERTRLIAVGRRSYTLKDSGVIMKLAPEFEATIMALFGEYYERTGKKVLVTSAYRSPEKQAKLYQAYCSGKGPMAAKPGKSKHETGNAIDVNSPDANYMDDKGLLKKYKLHRPYLRHPKHPEAWHIEAMGGSPPADCSDTSLNVQPAGAPQSAKALKAEEKLGVPPGSTGAATPVDAMSKPTITPASYTPPPSAVIPTDAFVAGSKANEKQATAQLESQRRVEQQGQGANLASAAAILDQQLRVQLNMDKSLTSMAGAMDRIEKLMGGKFTAMGDKSAKDAAKDAGPPVPGGTTSATRSPPVSVTRV